MLRAKSPSCVKKVRAIYPCNEAEGGAEGDRRVYSGENNPSVSDLPRHLPLHRGGKNGTHRKPSP